MKLRFCLMCALCVVFSSAFFVAAETPCENAMEQEAGFVSIFNGKDLGGWTGDTAGYEVEDGILVAKESSGNLYTDAEYGDFIFRFSFMLTPGANNGIGIRVPLHGSASGAGHEIQILDDSAERYRDVEAWQRHGSVYGIIPAKTGYLKPVGEWNDQEIHVEGSKIRVTLNGEVIVDADLAPYRDVLPTPDGKKHPGLKRERGHLSLAGHRTRLFFRNLRIKPLSPTESN